MTLQVDIWDDGRIAGWAYDPSSPADRLSVFLDVAGREIGSVKADAYRADLHDVCGDGRCSFSIDLAEFPSGLLDRLSIRTAIDPTIGAPSGNVTGAGPSQTRSPFGGLWIDRTDWLDLLHLKRRAGMPEPIFEQILNFARDGYVVIKGAVSRNELDRFNGDMDEAFADPARGGLNMLTYLPGEHRPTMMAMDPRYRYDRTTKIFDPHARLASARLVAAPPALVAFLAAILDAKPRVFQQVYFSVGSEQAFHKETAYSRVDSDPLALVLSWLALEDVKDGAGELEVYAGSHLAPDFTFGAYSKWILPAHSGEGDYIESIHRDAARYGHERRSLHVEAGDMIVLHADLAHGGAAVTDPGHTRRSLVTHYTREDYKPFYERSCSNATVTQDDIKFSSRFYDAA